MTPLRQLLLLIPLFLGTVVGGLAAENAARAPARLRVVSQTVGTDELLLALAEPEQIAALSHLSRERRFSAVASQASAYPQLVVDADAESVVRMGVDLVLCADYSRVELVSQLRRAGVRVIVFTKYKTLEDSYANLRLLARELGAESRAEQVIAACEQRARKLAERLVGAKPVKVIVPSIYGVLAGRETTFQDLCNHAAADNLGASLGGLVGHQPPPAEKMLLWPIEKLVIPGKSVEEALAPFRSLPPYQYLAAVREARVILIPEHILSCVTHHRVEGYEILARALHPDLFAGETDGARTP